MDERQERIRMATKKDYELVAKVIKQKIENHRSPEAYMDLEDLASDLCDAFEADNEQFDTERFLRACGVTAEED